MSNARRYLALMIGALAVTLLSGCQTTGVENTRTRSVGSTIKASWEPIAASESQISIGGNPRVLQRRARRNTTDGMYTEVMGLANGSMLYEKRRVAGRSKAESAEKELLRRWRDDAALKAAGISLNEAKMQTRSTQDGEVQVAIAAGEGGNRSCSVFFRYSPKTELGDDGAPTSKYETVTGVICQPRASGADSAVQEAALQLATSVAFDGGKSAQTAMFANLLEGNRDKLLSENLIAAKPVVGPKPPVPPGPQDKAVLSLAMNGVPFGRYHALVLAAESYEGGIPRLDTPGNDARKVSAMLRDQYGFEVRMLIDPRKSDIVNALTDYSQRLGPQDNLLIYYAGHGFVDKTDGQGYWLPIGPPRSVVDTWVSNKALATAIQSINADHVLVVSDACFSGSLVGARQKRAKELELSLQRWVRLRGRTALASGNLELVDDDAGNGHSPFATSFLSLLGRNEGLISGEQLAALVTNFVRKISPQTPQYGRIVAAGHEPGADFFFVPVRSRPVAGS